MAIYSIKDLEILTGIKAHTIRVWERRYNLVDPGRTNTNIRCYSDEDLKRLLNVSILNQNGFKISKIAELDDAQLRSRVLDLCMDPRNNNVMVESLLVAMLELDELKFSRVLASSIIKIGFEATIEEVLFPFLERIGVLWQSGTINPGQEHFISNLIRQKLMVAIDTEMQNTPVTRKQRILFFTPEQEWHDMGLLFFSLLARKAGFEIIYLGASVPLADLNAVRGIRPYHALFFTMVGARKKDDFYRLIREIDHEFPNFPVFVSGLQFKEQQPLLPPNFVLCPSAATFKQALAQLFRA